MRIEAKHRLISANYMDPGVDAAVNSLKQLVQVKTEDHDGSTLILGFVPKGHVHGSPSLSMATLKKIASQFSAIPSAEFSLNPHTDQFEITLEVE